MSKLNDIVSGSLAKLNGINGVNTVSNWRSVNFDEQKWDELPALNLREVSDEYDDNSEMTGTNIRVLHRLYMEVDIVINGSSVPTAIRNMIHNIETALATNETFNSTALRTQPLGWEINTVEQNENRIGMATYRFRVDFYTNKFSES